MSATSKDPSADAILTNVAKKTSTAFSGFMKQAFSQVEEQLAVSLQPSSPAKSASFVKKSSASSTAIVELDKSINEPVSIVDADRTASMNWGLDNMEDSSIMMSEPVAITEDRPNLPPRSTESSKSSSANLISFSSPASTATSPSQTANTLAASTSKTSLDSPPRSGPTAPSSNDSPGKSMQNFGISASMASAVASKLQSDTNEFFSSMFQKLPVKMDKPTALLKQSIMPKLVSSSASFIGQKPVESPDSSIVAPAPSNASVVEDLPAETVLIDVQPDKNTESKSSSREDEENLGGHSEKFVSVASDLEKNPESYDVTPVGQSFEAINTDATVTPGDSLRDISTVTGNSTPTASPQMKKAELFMVSDEKKEPSIREEFSSEAVYPMEVNVMEEEHVPEIIPAKEEISSNESEKVADASNQLKAVLEQRERQLMSATEQNASLNSTINSHREQITTLEQKIIELNKTLAEKDEQLSRTIAASSSPQSNQKLIDELQKLVKTKSEQIQGLLDEGNQLSVNNGKLSQALKALRQKFNENQDALTLTEKKYADVQNQFNSSKERISEYQTIEKNLQASIKSLTRTNDELRAQVANLETDLTKGKDQQASLQATIDRAWQEIAELRKNNAISASEQHEAAMEKEIAANAQLKQEIQMLKAQHAELEQSLRKEIFQYKTSLSRIEDEISWKEDAHRKEIASFQQKLQAADLRNDELSQSVQEASKPLLRQIESLQAYNASVQQTFRDLETNLNQQLSKAISERDTLSHTCRDTNLKVEELERKANLLTEKLEHQQKERLHLVSQLEKEKSQCVKMTEKCKELEIKLENAVKENNENSYLLKMQIRESINAEFQQKLQEEQQKTKQVESLVLEKQMEIERMRVKISDMRSKESNKYIASSADSISSTTAITSPSMNAIQTSPSIHSYGAEIHQNFRITSLENQLAHLEQQLKSALDAKEQVSEDFVKLTIEHNKLRTSSQDVVLLQSRYDDLLLALEAKKSEVREKNNTIQEMREDILELKEMYRNQIDELITKLDNYEQHEKRRSSSTIASPQI